MRQAFANVLHQNTERKRLSVRIQNGTATAEDHQRHAQLTDAVMDGLVAEVRALNHDVSAAQTRARRPF